jgi:hypothetical protein
MKSFRLLPLLVLVTPAWAVPASPWPYLEVTATEILETEPLRVRTTCTITEVGFQRICGEILIEPLDHATTRLYECGATPPLECSYNSSSTQSLARELGEREVALSIDQRGSHVRGTRLGPHEVLAARGPSAKLGRPGYRTRTIRRTSTVPSRSNRRK